MLCFLNKKKNEKPLNLNFKFFILTTRSIFFAHGQNFLNGMNNEWFEGKHSQTMNKVHTKEKTVKVAEFERVSKIYVA